MIDVRFDPAAFEQLIASMPRPETLSRQINRDLARDGELRLKEKYSGGPMSRYLTARSGKTREQVRGIVIGDAAVISVSGPQVQLLEDGGTIVPKKGTPVRNRQGQILRYIPFLRFRLYEPQDTDTPTGRWVMARRVTIQARHPVRDTALEVLGDVGLFLDQHLRGAP
ncbi:hypothetical protein EHF33_20690 (plasmid) [Deinococcus psychrotolerans]|uniref:Uncharacterized protein n=1 Tax=Deinococcus psychrotolerans TaxID=2489213 RepID=A0A3G8YKX9_9DEIO|nr:hypothetical protein [Deinococcus psychrotolerans]AZI45330.1 hypothetical protein EHF33_20690 [Deinococcus psychrotolerans]